MRTVCLGSVVVYCVRNRSYLEQLYVCHCTNELYTRTVCKDFALPYHHTFPFLYTVPLFLYTLHFSTFFPFLTLWSIHFTILRTSDLSVRKFSIQFLCTAHLYSDEHTVFVIRIYIIDTVYGSHFYLTVKNQRHHMIGINDCENLGMVKWNWLCSTLGDKV
jgi:hypothetical protein